MAAATGVAAARRSPSGRGSSARGRSCLTCRSVRTPSRGSRSRGGATRTQDEILARIPVAIPIHLHDLEVPAHPGGDVTNAEPSHPDFPEMLPLAVARDDT